MKPLLLSTNEAREVLGGVAPKTLHELRRAGEIKAVRKSHRPKSQWQWLARSIEDYVNKLEATA